MLVFSTRTMHRSATSSANFGFCAAFVLSLAAVALPSRAAIAQQDLASLVQQARDKFQPVTPDEVASARAELKREMQGLESWVHPSSSNGQMWLKYLRWNDLKAEVAKDAPADLQILDASLGKINHNENGLELPRFRKVAALLRRLRDRSAVSAWENPGELYGRQLEALQRQLDTYRGQPTPANEIALGQRLRIINDIGQAPELIEAVRHEFSRPNAFIDISTRLIAAGVDPINRSERITDNILGTNIHGTAYTTGTVAVSSIPSEKTAVLEFMSEGHSHSENVGYNGPAVIRSTASTDFAAIKRVQLTDLGFTGHAASADAHTHSNIHSISKRGGGLGSRLVSSIGWRRANSSHGRADAIAGDHAEDRIERQFNQEVNDELRDARKRYEDNYRRPMLRRGELPEYIRFSSDKDSLSVETTQANAGQLGATNEPPASPEGHDMAMRLHASAVNNYTANVLGGATASETAPGQDTKFDVELPEWMRNAWDKSDKEFEGETPAADEPFKPYSMTLRDRPITVEFVENKVKLTTHIARLRSGDQEFTNWDITGTYVPELADGGVVLQREGDLVVLPSDFRGSLNSRQTAERSNLEKDINERSARGRGFPEKMQLDPLKPEGQLSKAGPLAFEEFTSNDGWVTIAWDRQTKTK